MEPTGRIHSLESFATLDGDGIRYAVFLAGCRLHCAYCHNPDTWASQGAIRMTPEQLVAKAARYKTYFGTDGGVTFSGGEPLLQADFICACAPLLTREGIAYALDTSGYVPLTDAVRRATEGAELVILDLKFPDAEGYRQFIGGTFETILAYGDYADRHAARLWLRTVVVPGVNDTEEAVEAYARTAKRWTRIEKYELLGFHTMGFDKYARLGIENPLAGTAAMDERRLAQLQRKLDAARK